MPISFVTWNIHKLQEIQSLLSDFEIVQLDINLPEIQSLDPKKVVEHKLREAMKYTDGAVMVDDTSWFLDWLNGFPGPLLKRMIDGVTPQGIYTILQHNWNLKAKLSTYIAYADDNHQTINYFEASIHGIVVAPRGEHRFGSEAIFQPNGYDKTLAEMSMTEKNSLSMRSQAAKQLKEFLSSQKAESRSSIT